MTVTSAAALPSDVSGLAAGRYVRFGLLARLARAKHPAGREGDIAAALAVARGWRRRPTRSTRTRPGSGSSAR